MCGWSGLLNLLIRTRRAAAQEEQGRNRDRGEDGGREERGRGEEGKGEGREGEGAEEVAQTPDERMRRAEGRAGVQ